VVQRLVTILIALALAVSLGTDFGSGRAEAQQATITPEERKACEDLRTYMDKFKALVRQSQGKERDSGIIELKKDFGPRLVKLPGQAKTELAEWEKSCTRLFDAPASEEDQHAEAVAKNFGIMRQICGGTLKP
jgi:hypothetical protein